jgi:hypothetical protein
MKTRLWYCVGMMAISFCTHAQTYLEAGYSGATIFHPGANVTYGKVLGTKTNERRNTRQEWIGGLGAGFYYHKNRHTGVYVNPLIEWIKTNRKGFQYGLELPVGYLRTFIPNVYQIQENSQIDRLPFAGTSHLVISPALRLGHRFSENSFINGWYIKNRVMLITPYAGGLTPQYFLEAGLVKSLK